MNKEEQPHRMPPEMLYPVLGGLKESCLAAEKKSGKQVLMWRKYQTSAWMSTPLPFAAYSSLPLSISSKGDCKIS